MAGQSGLTLLPSLHMRVKFRHHGVANAPMALIEVLNRGMQ